MNPIKPEIPKTPKSPETSNPQPLASVETPQAGPTIKAEKPSKGGRDGKRILSVAIPEKLARQIKLLCGVEGTTAQAVVEAALKRAVNKRLAAALDSIKADVGE